jgi:hypothetical protein
MDRKKFEAIMSLDGPERAEHAMKRIVDTEELWGLYSDGWAASATNDDETDMFPIWPDPQYASASAVGDWAGYEPRSIPLDTFLNVFLPNLEEEGTLVSIFRLPSGVSVPVTPAVSREIVEAESQNYL